MTTIARKSDFKLRWFSGSGGGGQHRNKHQNCLELIHLPTGMSETVQGKSRSQNRKLAFQRLAKRIVAHYCRSEAAPRSTEVIRTYHEPRNEVRDKASGKTIPYSNRFRQLGELIEARADAKKSGI